MSVSTDISDLAKSIRGDLDSVVFGDFGTDATYRAAGVGSGAGVAVRVGITDVMNGRRPGLGQVLGGRPSAFGSAAPQGRGASMRLQVKASLPGETADGTGAFASGGILRPKVGDTFEVAGFAAGRPEVASVRLGVASVDNEADAQLVGGVKWNVGVKP